MGERLRADLARIGEVAAQITRIGTEFSQATALTECYAPALGSAHLAGVLNTFASGWSIHRQRLIDDLSQEAGLAQAAMRGYRDTDDQLAAALGEREAARLWDALPTGSRSPARTRCPATRTTSRR